MKKFIYLLSGVALLFSCDKVENPYIPKVSVELDTTLYSGLWSDYESNEWPVFAPNTNTNRNILIEDYTGHQCGGCPAAATEATSLANANPGRVYLAAIHTSPGGAGAFQALSGNYTRDFTTPEGELYGQFFGINQGATYGFFSNPSGNINRIPYGPNMDGTAMFDIWQTWANRVNGVIADNDLKIDLQVASNYYADTDGGYIHTEVEFKEAMNGNFKMVAMVLQKSIIDYQLVGSTQQSDYEHKHTFIGTIDGQAWGREVATGDVEAGTKLNFDYSYKIPDGLTKDDIEFIIYVHNDDTKEIHQVIEHHF